MALLRGITTLPALFKLMVFCNNLKVEGVGSKAKILPLPFNFLDKIIEILPTVDIPESIELPTADYLE